MKRFYIKLFIVGLLSLSVFAYVYYNTVHDSDVFQTVQQRIEQKTKATKPLIFNDMRIAQRFEQSKGEMLRVCGDFQYSLVGNKQAFVAIVSISNNKISSAGQILLADSEFTRSSIRTLCAEQR
ncbi:hypothetical protein [Moellerella wisconsensis]|uniref:Uncharacterized protein n=1 Tax=Moellerella wisconsensis ATCC 35017 TaxID=1354267 RepID=A0A0N0I9Z7_9GAMM|nr:hypothetical protein [Moellerella wisconsensis]KPD02612.1 hypothetical protein M992_1767 [Moellerella wisconsensis ATCC 35017]